MLVGQHGGWDEHGHLLAVGGGLEGGADGDFGLAEAHVAADEAVHGLVRLHVGLDGLGGGQLVGGILIDERGLQLLLHVRVGRERETFLVFALGIEADEVAGDVLELRLGALLHLVPLARADAVEFGRNALLAAVFGELVEGVD